MKKTAGIWAIIAINIVYILSIIISILGQVSLAVLSDPVSLVIIALNALIIFLFLVSTYHLFTLRGHIMGWFNAVFATVIISKLLNFGAALLLYSSTVGSQQIISTFISGSILVLVIWIGSYSYLKKFLKNPQFAAEQQIVAAKSGSMKAVIVVAVIIIIGIVPTLTYQFYYVPQHNNILVQTSITDNLASAMVYSINHQNNFKGYQPTLLNEAPKCSGPLTINITPDGNTVVVFGKSCTTSIYYCSTFSTNTLDNINYGPMATVPANLVTATKFDCTDPTNLPLGFSQVISKPSPPTPGVAVFNIKYFKDVPNAIEILKSFGATNCKNNWPNDSAAFMCTVPVGQEDAIVAAASSSPKISSASRWGGSI